MSAPRARAVALLLSLLAPACGANKNHAERERAAAASEAEADALDAGRPDGCIRSCLPDHGSRPVDCAKAEEGIEFMPLEKAIWNFNNATFDGVGSYQGYMYNDGSAPPAVRTFPEVERCGKAGNKVLHVQGGPFAGWGGGVGISIRDWWNRPEVGGAVDCVSPSNPPLCENNEVNPPGINGRFVDASQWDGISVWARRGPEGQAGFRVTLGDKYTDDEQNIDQDQGMPNSDGANTEQQYCKRARTCSCHSNKACLPWTEPDTWPDGTANTSALAERTHHLCYDPRYDPPIKGRESGKTANDPSKFILDGFPTEVPVDFCGQEACDQKSSAGGDDTVFKGRACTPYQLQTGDIVSYCFNPGQDPNPPENYERCGDHWQTPVRLSTDWQLFLVPFNDMRQQGYGKESAKLLTDQLSVFRLTWEGGYVDYYVDDVRFYRVRH